MKLLYVSVLTYLFVTIFVIPLELHAAGAGQHDFALPQLGESSRCEPGFVRNTVTGACTCPPGQQPLLSLTTGSSAFGRCGNTNCSSLTVTATGNPMLLSYGSDTFDIPGDQYLAQGVKLDSGNIFLVYRNDSAKDLQDSQVATGANVSGRVLYVNQSTGVLTNTMNYLPVTVNQDYPPTTAISGNQHWPAIDVTRDIASYVGIVYHDNRTGYPTGASGDDVIFKLYSQGGVHITNQPMIVNETKTGNQSTAKIAALGNGNFVVTWQGAGGNGSGDDSAGAFFDIIDPSDLANFIPDEKYISSNASANSLWEGAADVAALGSSKFVAVFQAWYNNSDNVYFRIFNNDGTAVTSNIQASDFSYNSQHRPRVASLPSGVFMVTWDNNGSTAAPNGEQRDPDGSPGVYGRVFNSDGTPRSPEIKVSTYIPNTQHLNEITVLDDKYFIVSWESLEETDGTADRGVYAQMFNKDGVQLGSEINLSQGTSFAGHTYRPEVVDSIKGQFIAYWYRWGNPSGSIDTFGGSSDANGTKIIGKRFTYDVNEECE